MKCYNCGPGQISEADTKQLCVRCALVWMFDPAGKLTWRHKDAVTAGVHALIDKAESVSKSLTEWWRDAKTPVPPPEFARACGEAEASFIRDEFARYFAKRKPATEPLYPTTGEGSTVTVTPQLRYRPGDQSLPIPNQHPSMRRLPGTSRLHSRHGAVAGSPPPARADRRRTVTDTRATFDESRRYRFSLMRLVDEDGTGDCLFIILNPSTADETVLDPTCRRCFNFAKAWGYQRLTVANLFALRATDPAALYTAPDPEHPKNMQVVRSLAAHADLVVCAWGVHGAHLRQGDRVREALREDGYRVYCLGLTKDGYPRHPLYLKNDTAPILWP